MSAESIVADEHGFVTLLGLEGERVGRAPLHDRVPADVPEGRNRGERRRAKRLRRTQKKDRARSATFLWELEVLKVHSILEQLAAEGRILKVGPDQYQALPNEPTLADRLAERRERALGSVVVRKRAGEGEQS